MQNFLNKFDNFSIEILLEIFEYLSTNDCFNAFYNLNWRINSALNLSGLSIDLTRISRQKFNEFYKKLIFPNHQQQIRKLKLSNDLTIDLPKNFFHDFHLRDFKQLRSLTFIKPSYLELGSIALIIPHLKQLEHISIDSNSYSMNFFELVTTKSSSIKSCYLPGLKLEEELSFQSNIEYLTITVENITILSNLLTAFPRLKYLNVSLFSTLYTDDECLPESDVISCENLQILKLQILQESSINFNEIEYFFQHKLFHHLQSFSYNCATSSLEHIDVIRWNIILTKYLSKIKQFQFFVQIPNELYSYIDIKQTLTDMQTSLCYASPLTLSISHSSYIIHTSIYPKNYFHLSSRLFNSDQYSNYDPINCETEIKYSKVNSIVVDGSSILIWTVLPKNIKYLQIQDQNKHLNLNKCFEHCAKQLLSLKIDRLSDDIPQMPNLRELTILQVIFNLNMVSKLSILCPRLELLTIEINCIEQFGEILNQLRYKSNMTELKFLRVFSRDSSKTWSSWLKEKKQLITNHNAIYEEKNLFLFIWL